jgi:hypothetical protein
MITAADRLDLPMDLAQPSCAKVIVWGFSTIARPGPARDLYDRRRARGDKHPAAMRHLFNRFLGQLYHCLQTGQTYDPIKAFGTLPDIPERAAA